MIVKKISASFSCKKQIYQFEPIEVFMAVEAEVSDGEDIAAAQAKIFEIAKQGVEQEIVRLTGKSVLPRYVPPTKLDF